MFCRLKILRNVFIFLISVLSVWYAIYSYDYKYMLTNENGSIATNFKDNAVILFTQFNQEDIESLKKNNTAAVLFGQGSSLIKQAKVRTIVILHPVYQKEQIADEHLKAWFNNFKRKFSFDVEFFIDHKGVFSKKFKVKEFPTSVLFKSGIPVHKVTDYMFQWSTVDSAILLFNKLGVTIGI
ncbi:MAG: hypothetical protein H6845_00045 [Alphaproteobacteria bacterium]|nr:MAG: hypothetical protein H6845_00045 [Alphaproteobacteria bacterium]